MSKISKGGYQNGSDQIKSDDQTFLIMIHDQVKKLTKVKMTFLQQHRFEHVKKRKMLLSAITSFYQLIIIITKTITIMIKMIEK